MNLVELLVKVPLLKWSIRKTLRPERMLPSRYWRRIISYNITWLNRLLTILLITSSFYSIIIKMIHLTFNLFFKWLLVNQIARFVAFLTMLCKSSFFVLIVFDVLSTSLQRVLFTWNVVKLRNFEFFLHSLFNIFTNLGFSSVIFSSLRSREKFLPWS